MKVKRIFFILLLIIVIYTMYPEKTRGISISDSYSTWSPYEMIQLIEEKYETSDIEVLLNRSKMSIYIEWWFHNIGYYITKPFDFAEKTNARCKDVDLERWVRIYE